MKRKWRLEPQEYNAEYDSCLDCGLHYGAFAVEMVITAEEWELINPTPYKGCGLLCHECMIQRLKFIGIDSPTITGFIILDTHAHKWSYHQEISLDTASGDNRAYRKCVRCRAEQLLFVERIGYPSE